MENFRFHGGAFNPLNYYKFVGRFMTAVDSAAFMAGQGMMKHEVARETARAEGLTGVKLKKRTSDLLNNSEAISEGAVQQATQEIEEIDERQEKKFGKLEKNRQIRIRTNEIIEENIPEEIVADAKNFAAFVTFNYESVGVIGLLAKTFAGLSRKFPPFRLIVPFTRVVANVLNQQIDYTPWGYLRAFGLSPSNFIPIDSTGAKNAKERNRQIIKATMGTMLMVGLYAMAKTFEDDDDPFFEITGKGPSDFNKRNQLFSQGWKPYSVKIGDQRWSYQFTQLGVGLSIIGNWLDNEKFKELGEKDLITKTAFAVQSSASGILDMSFLTGLSGLMSALTNDSNPEKQADKLFKSLGRTATSLVPNAFKQIDKAFFDNTIYDTKTVASSLMKEVPFVRSNLPLKAKLDAFGQPVKKQGNRFFTDITDDKIWLMMGEKEVFVPGASPNVKMPDGELMTHEEFYDYIKISGTAVRKILEKNFDNFNSLETKILQKTLNKLFLDQRKIAKGKIQAKRLLE